MVLKNLFFIKKLKTLCSLEYYNLVQISLECDTTFLRNVSRDFRLPMSALATVAGKSFNSKLLQKLIFRSGILYNHCWCWHWKSKVSPIHYLRSIWTTCWWNLKKIAWSELYKILSFLTKKCHRFWLIVDAILEDISVTETIIVWCIILKTTIVQCSKHYDSPTRVTRLKLYQTWQTQSVLTKRDRSLTCFHIIIHQKPITMISLNF